MFITNEQLIRATSKRKDNKRMANEVGIIGQMYENRVNKKIGVLEERNEKFKTLLMRDSDGGTFSVNYSTFKSNWRKYKGDEAIQTLTQVEEAKTEKAEKVVKEKPSKPIISKQEQVQMVNATKEIVEEVFSSHEVDVVIKVTYKGAITVRCVRRGALEIWLKYGKDLIDIYIADSISKSINIPEYATVVVKDNWRYKTRLTIPSSEIKNFIESTVTVIKNYSEQISLENKEKKSHKEESEEEE